MKKIIVLSGLFLSLNFSFAQTANLNVEKDFMNYSKLVAENKIDEALDYTNPKLFEIIPRETMKSSMEAVFKMLNMEYKVSPPTIMEFSEMKRIKNIDYIKIKTISPIEMKFNDIDLSDENTLRRMQNSFEEKFGKGNVIYNKETGFFKITAHKEIVASSTDGKNNWKFITVDNPKMRALLETIIPAEVLE